MDFVSARAAACKTALQKDAHLSCFRVVSGAFCAYFVMLAGSPLFAEDQTSQIHLTPHRAVYAVSLAASSGRNSIASASGQMVYDFSGDACDGYSTRTRFLTLLQPHEGKVQSNEMRSSTIESGDGKVLNFINATTTSKGTEMSEGIAEKTTDDAVNVTLSKPKLIKHAFKGPLFFPTAHTIKILETAKSGAHVMEADFFDGSDGGEKAQGTTAIIGNAVKTPFTSGEASVADIIKTQNRYPVTLSFFDREASKTGEQLALYQLNAEMTDGGITTKMRMDYPDFSLDAILVSLELLPATACKN